MSNLITFQLDTPLLPLQITCTAEGILVRCSFWPSPDIPPSTLQTPPAAAGSIIDELLEYAHGDRREFTIPIGFSGTDFQVSVWGQTRKIPYGTVRTYREIARRIGRPQASRAIGNALGANPLLIIIPCHRVVPSSGGLGGFTGGSRIKQLLLDHEGTALPQTP